MTEYNVDLERALRERPVPGKQVPIAVESILAPKAKAGGWRKRMAFSFAACIVAISIVFLSKDAWLLEIRSDGVPFDEGYHASNSAGDDIPPMKQEEAAALGELQPDERVDPQLAELDWGGLLEGTVKVDGLEILHRETIDEASQLLFMARKGGIDYAYELLTVEIEKGENEQYEAVTTFSAIPLKGPGTYERQADNDWITYNWGSYRHEDGRTVRFAFGYVLNERLTEVRMANQAGEQESALQLSHANGQRFWFKLLSPALSEGPMTIEALNSLSERLMLVGNDGQIQERYSKSIQNMDAFSAVSQKEWREIADGAIGHPYIELLHKEMMDDGSQMLFLADYDKSLPVKGYKMYMVNLRKDSRSDVWLPGSLGTSAALDYDENRKETYGNEFFHYSWGALDSHGFVFGIIRKPEVAKLQLTDLDGEKTDLELITNEQGDTFFLHFYPNNEQGRLTYSFEAFDESGNMLYQKKKK